MKLFLTGILILFSGLGQSQNLNRINTFNHELDRFQLMIKADTMALRNVLSDELLYIHSNSLVESKKEHLLTIGSGSIQYKHIDVEESGYKKYKKLVLTDGIIHVRGVFKSVDFDVRLRYTAVYKKNRNTWQLLRWQSTKMG